MHAYIRSIDTFAKWDYLEFLVFYIRCIYMAK